MKNVKEIKVEVKGKDWDNAIDKAFNAKKKDIKLPGFRKGSVTKEIYIKKAGVESLYMDACDIAVKKAFEDTMKKETAELACEPNVSIEKIDKDGVTFVFTLITRPEIKLGKYTKLGIKCEKAEVTKEEIEHEIDHIRSHMAEVVVKEKGTVETGNTAVIDFDGVVDGKALQGGSGKDYALEIGSNSFIPGFEDGLIGMKKGETKVLKLTFPKEYTEELKGKKVEFTVTVKEIKERVLPEFNKEFFEDLAIDGVDSKEKLEKHVKEDLEHAKKHEVENKYVDEVLKCAVENMKVEINPEIIDDEVERMIKEYSQQLSMQGLSFDNYLKMTGSKIEDVKEMMKPQAEARVKTRYLLEEIVECEKIEATKEEVEAEIKKLSESYGIDKKQILESLGGDEAIKYQVKMDKALEIVKA